MFMFSLAEALHKTIDELGAMTEVEFVAWAAYHKLKQRKK